MKDRWVQAEVNDLIERRLSPNPLVTIHKYPGADHAFARHGGGPTASPKPTARSRCRSTSSSGISDAHPLEPGHPHGRRRAAARRRLPAGARGALPGDPLLRPYGKGYAFQESNARPGSASRRRTPRSSKAPPTSTRRGSWSIPRNGCRRATRWCASTRAAPAARRECSIPGRPRDEGPLRLHRMGGVQPWSSGKVGLNGISYYAMNAWQVARLQPPHLAAFCAWKARRPLPRSAAPRRHRSRFSPTGSRAPCIACSTAWASAA